MRRIAPVALPLALVLLAGGCGKKGSDGYSHAHKKGHLTYADSPPKGGAHSSYWLRCGVYVETVPAENAVHSMEHGAVWISYRPDLAAADVAKVAALAQLKPDYVIVAPYPGLSAPVVASAWGQQITAQAVTDPALSEFVKKYAGGDQGGEGGADCAHGLLPAEGRKLLDDPSFKPPSFGR
jgi:hypothetical protein